MRRFSSYGPIDTETEYYAPRTQLIERICTQLIGDSPSQGGHYSTVWAPRQTGKTWAMNQVLFRLRREQPDFDVVKLELQDLGDQKSDIVVYQSIIARINRELGSALLSPTTQAEFVHAFSREQLHRPLILILDEFDTLQNSVLYNVVAALRNIYNTGRREPDKASADKTYLLHGVALIGVRSVLGVENASGSPFNVQRSVQIPNLTKDEVQGMFQWYEEESGQKFEEGVIDRIYDELQGQPGLTCWLGELLTEQYNNGQSSITMQDFQQVYGAALNLPNNNILNVLSKAKDESSRPLVLRLFETQAKIPFRYDDPQTNFLYLNGVLDEEVVTPDERYLKFSSPFVQKRLFNFFAHELFRGLDHLHDPLLDLSETITDTTINVTNVMRYYEAYLQKNRGWLFKNAPRRKTDERIYEAVYHFNLYMYLTQFMQSYQGQVIPEFPTGNGQIDLLIRHAGLVYGLEVKSFVNRRQYQAALEQSAAYAHQLRMEEIWLVFFIETIDEENRQQLEATYVDSTVGVKVYPVFVVIGG